MSDGENTTIIKRAAAERGWFVAWFLKWQPVVIRGAIYFSIAYLTPFVGTLKLVGPHVILDTWTWLDWVQMHLECSLAGLLILRTYMDNSMARHTEKVKND